MEAHMHLLKTATEERTKLPKGNGLGNAPRQHYNSAIAYSISSLALDVNQNPWSLKRVKQTQ